MVEYDIKQLRQLTGTEPRNIYFYVQQGLLPNAEGTGLAARYSEEHRVRLLAIRALKAQGRRLDEIRSYFEKASISELRRLVGESRGTTGTAPASHPRSVLFRSWRSRPAPDGLPAAFARADAPQAQTLFRFILAPGVELLVDERSRDAVAGRFESLVRAVRRILGAGSRRP